MSPTARSLKELRRRGYTAAVVEKTIRTPGRTFKRDCFGFDILAVKIGLVGYTVEPEKAGLHQTGSPFICRGTGQTLGVQACAGTDHAKRRAKILANPEARTWVAAGNSLAVWSWAKRGARGEVKRWQLREDNLLLEDFPR